MLYQNKKSNSKLKSPVQGIKYSSKEYSNPFFSKKRKGRGGINFSFSWKIKLIFSLIAALFLVILSLLIYLPYFKIIHTEISGQGKIDEQTIREITKNKLKQNFYTFLPGDNIFIFNQNKLRQELENKFVFQNLEIKTRLPNKLIISYIEEKYAIIYEEDEIYYYTDENGNIIEEVSVLEIDQKQYPILKNQSNDKIVDKQVKVDQKILSYTIEAFNYFQELANSNFELSNFQVNSNPSNNFWMIIKDGPAVYLNHELNFKDQLQKLIILKEEKLKENFSDKEYIDLRFGDSIYFR